MAKERCLRLTDAEAKFLIMLVKSYGFEFIHEGGYEDEIPIEAHATLMKLELIMGEIEEDAENG